MTIKPLLFSSTGWQYLRYFWLFLPNLGPNPAADEPQAAQIHGVWVKVPSRRIHSNMYFLHNEKYIKVRIEIKFKYLW